jgi:beta-N-acetylhexosaminidase
VAVLSAVALGVTAVGQPAASAAADQRGPRLTRAQLAGQRIIYSYPGLTPPQSLLDHISRGEAAGVIFFGENIASPMQIAGVVRQLREAAR